MTQDRNSQDRKSKQTKKYMSVRRALKELKISEDDLKEKVNKGTIKAYQDEDEVKFDAQDIKEYMQSRAEPREKELSDNKSQMQNSCIEDENLYETRDGTYDSLFMSRSVITQAEEMAASEFEKSAQFMLTDNDRKQMMSKETRDKGKDKHIVISKPVVSSKKKPRVPKYDPPSPEGENAGAWLKVFSSSEMNKVFVPIIAALLLLNFLILVVFTYSVSPRKNSFELIVHTSRAIEDEFVAEIYASGQVVASDRFAIYAEAEGRVVESFVEEGDQVVEGTPLLRLYNAKVDNAVKTSRNKFAQAQRKLEETRLEFDLAKAKLSQAPNEIKNKVQKMMSVREELDKLSDIENRNQKEQERVDSLQEIWLKIDSLDKISSALVPYWSQIFLGQLRSKIAYDELIQARVALKEAQKGQNSLVLKSPGKGKILKTWAKTSSYLRVGDEVILIEEGKNFKVEAYLSEKDYTQIDISSPVEVTFSVFPSKSLSGNISKVSSFLETQGENVGAKMVVTLEGETNFLQSGFSARIKATSKLSNGVLVPRQAVISQKGPRGEEQLIVYRIIKYKEKEQVYSIPVTVQGYNEEYAQLVTGVEDQELIATGPLYVLRKLNDRDVIITK